MNRLLLILAFSFCFPAFAFTADYAFARNGCRISLKNDTLTLENGLIKRVWKWNNGNLITCGLQNKETGNQWNTKNKQADLFLPSESQQSGEAEIVSAFIEDSPQYCQHIRTTIQYSLGKLKIKKILKIYPDCPAIATELWFKGSAAKSWFNALPNAVDLKNIETITRSAEAAKMPVMEQLVIQGNHWKIKSIEFFDVTDRFNTLVFPVNTMPYRQDALYKGNLLFTQQTETGEGLFIQKEAPNSNTQLYYPQGDFLVGQGTFKVIGLGIDSCDIHPQEWHKGYGYVTGVYKGETQRDLALRNYQQRVRPFLADRDEMVMSNTWGDRGQDKRVNETFCLKELELASKMGVSRLQIDDGWQAGKSANSAFGGSFKDIWSNPDYWKPDPVKFPNGLAPLIKRGKELGIEICLWFNPSIQDNYADWEKDAAALIGLYKTYGIRTFKIDGTNIPNKEAEIRLRKLYETVMQATEWKAVLNLDATAGRRGGYFYFNEYGNFFLENRYTDWANYYPYRTLRNLWMLSQYLPPQGLQIEFLNKWRNRDKYVNDRFAPENYSFDYLFAITMMAQPLAWMELANLPEEAFSTGETIKKYRAIQHDLHKGMIFPIGDEPDGRSWCGFQSIQRQQGYLLVFREDNEQKTALLATRLMPDKQVRLKLILGEGKDFQCKTGKNGEISFSLPKPNNFALYQFEYQDKK